MAFEIGMLACAAHEDARQQYAARLEAEEVRLARETLVLCANKGNVEARDALDALARTWAELHAEVEW